jgi:hypothetical protein
MPPDLIGDAREVRDGGLLFHPLIMAGTPPGRAEPEA